MVPHRDLPLHVGIHGGWARCPSLWWGLGCTSTPAAPPSWVEGSRHPGSRLRIWYHSSSARLSPSTGWSLPSFSLDRLRSACNMVLTDWHSSYNPGLLCRCCWKQSWHSLQELYLRVCHVWSRSDHWSHQPGVWTLCGTGTGGCNLQFVEFDFFLGWIWSCSVWCC